MAPASGTPGFNPEDESEDRRASRAASKYAGVGLQFAASILLFLYAGQWLDRRFGTAPWGVLVGVLVGASAAFYSMYRKLMTDLERTEKAKRDARERAERERSGGQ
jgi:ATP synthase protein I